MRVINHLISATALFCCLISTQLTATTIFMAGDSTMAIKDPKDYPETGWGVPFATFFGPEVHTVNLAKNGRSTRTFISEGLWQQISDNVKQGDVVFIQFGHNDQSEHKKDRYTTPEQYEQNIRNMIAEAKRAGAQVVLMTPITRRYFQDDGTLKLTHPYAQIVRKLAVELEVSFIDMEQLTKRHFEQQGEALSALRFMHIKPDLHPNYPNGIVDNTHLNRLGAREVAQIVLQQLKEQQHPITAQLRTPDPKHLKYRYKKS